MPSVTEETCMSSSECCVDAEGVVVVVVAVAAVVGVEGAKAAAMGDLPRNSRQRVMIPSNNNIECFSLPDA